MAKKENLLSFDEKAAYVVDTLVKIVSPERKELPEARLNDADSNNFFNGSRVEIPYANVGGLKDDT